MYVKSSQGISHLHYSGHLMVRSFVVRRVRAVGRLIIDHASFAQFQPNHFLVNMGRCTGAWEVQNQARGRPGNIQKKVPEDELCLCWPTVFVFSLRAKAWGEARVDQLAPIRFDHNAFNQLVRPVKEKKLIQTLVQQTFHDVEDRDVKEQGGSSDFIAGKGGGAVFLLHGNPGTGKTLTAESLAEMLERPLYTVSVGELGVTAQELERNLTQILELASIWRAIILLDEADVFLEKRTINDINRCALVGIFLRLLEYHDGIIFLTTNRVECFDPAFKSRISMALHYEDLTSDARATIWKQLSEKMNNGKDKRAVELDFKALGESYPLNGRQIRTCLRLSRALAETDKVDKITMENVAATAKIVQSLDEYNLKKG
mmetsp:Transcript_28026/g.47523  ORF Transcript_28026/g.47523 Transcript_28026/m.47523 type:complete len:373 (+) Transcript_28026:467-1585(+)